MARSRLLSLLCVLLLVLSASAIASCQAGSNRAAAIKDAGRRAENIKLLIAYQSKYGSTRQYAEWIQQGTGGDLVNLEDGDTPDLAGYDILIIGGYVRIGNIVIAPFIKNHWGEMKGKK